MIQAFRQFFLDGRKIAILRSSNKEAAVAQLFIESEANSLLQDFVVCLAVNEDLEEASNQVLRVCIEISGDKTIVLR